MKILSIIIASTFWHRFTAASGCKVTDVSTQFGEPPVQCRPKFRYWFPDASVPAISIEEDIRQISAVGGGGLEFLGFYNYGLGPAVTDWSIYGFGTNAFNELLRVALKTSAALGLAFDFAFGPNQGAGVPSEVETAGLAKELVYGNTTLHPGQTFSGAIPEPVVEFNQITGFMNTAEPWGSNELVAVVAGRVVAESLLSDYFYLSVLDKTTLIDLTNLTDAGSLKWTAPSGNGTWVLFAFYERYTNQRSCDSIANATTALGNGSWIVDHWSAGGAKKMTSFWDQQILSDTEIASLVKDIGGYAWEDSMEQQAALPWTPGFLSRFEKLHGYSIVPYLPILFQATNAWGGFLPPYNITYTLGENATDGGPYVQDYKAVISQGYLEYVDHFTAWASSTGVQLSNQPAYNMPVDMSDAITHVQVPELESLGFKEDIDLYRQFTGPAHLAGRNVISTEIGAVSGSAYKLRVPELKALFDGSYAAGVNTMVVHGYAYGGEYVNTTWPGYTPFQFEFSELWNHRQPAWKHLDDLFTYSARNSLVMRSGTPKVDVAMYYFENPWRGTKLFSGGDLSQHGYTYEYLGPKNLITNDAVVVDGVLAPEGPAFNALVMYNQTQITPDASLALLNFAENGLPIYIVGTTPTTTIGTTGQQQVSENMDKLLKHEHVHVTDIKSFSAAMLTADGISPRARVNAAANATGLFSFWTADAQASSQYVYLYNPRADGTFNITFSVGTDLEPFILDAWTGSQVQQGSFVRNDPGVTMSIYLRSEQTTIIAFMPGSNSTLTEYVIEHSANIVDVHVTETGSLEALISDDSSAWVTLNNGTKIDLPQPDSACSTTTTLDAWNLTVQAHGPSPDYSSLEGTITTIDVGMLDRLVPWTQIPQIEHASGVGNYTTTFNSSPLLSTAVHVDFGPILNTMKAWLNGNQVPPIDPTNPVVEVTNLLVDGTNVMEVQVTTSLFNAVKANVEHVRSVGYGPANTTRYTGEEWEEFGLVGPVKVITKRRVGIA